MLAKTLNPVVLCEATDPDEIISEIRSEAILLKAGALQNAIFNSANFSSIATAPRVSSRSSTSVPSGCWVIQPLRL